jgi:hypothetical protein
MTSLIPMTDIEALRAAGISYPQSVNAWRWLYRNRHERGVAGAFRRVGRRIVVDAPAFLCAVRSQPAS